ncbi:BH0509 family protein [Peribacillus frigoritolerans]
MSEQDRDFLVGFLTIKMGYSKSYLEKMSIKELENYYLDSLGENPE